MRLGRGSQEAGEMGKFSIEPVVVRQSFSHARTKPVIVEKIKRRTARTHEKTVLLCPSCGANMKLVRSSVEPGGAPKLIASCPLCGISRANE